MTFLLNVLLLFGLQIPIPVPVPAPAAAPVPAPAARVIVGLVDGDQLVVDNPVFSGFIETRGPDAVLSYRVENFHGNLSVKSISRVDFGEYQPGKPFRLTVTLRNGQKLEVQSERSDYLMVQGRTDTGTVVIKHPDPVTSVARLGTIKPDRKRDLKITYLEFPAS